METTRKDFERPVTYMTVGYRIYTPAYGAFFVDEYAERDDDDAYAIKTRSLALKALRQFIWDNHKNQGYTYDINDFYIESSGWYQE